MNTRKKTTNDKLVDRIFSQITPGKEPKVYNQQFQQYRDHIISEVPNNGSFDPKYELGKNRWLLESCIKYRDARNRTRCTSQNPVLVLIHPFYIFQSGRVIRHPEKKRELAKYKENIRNLLLAKNTDIVVFETAKDYASLTSVLHNEGAIADVVFTLNEYGYILEREKPRAREKLHNKHITVCGMYDRTCFSQAHGDIEKISGTPPCIIADAILQNSKSQGLFPSTYHNSNNQAIPKEYQVTTEEFLQIDKDRTQRKIRFY